MLNGLQLKVNNFEISNHSLENLFSLRKKKACMHIIERTPRPSLLQMGLLRDVLARDTPFPLLHWGHSALVSSDLSLPVALKRAQWPTGLFPSRPPSSPSLHPLAAQPRPLASPRLLDTLHSPVPEGFASVFWGSENLIFFSTQS